LHKFKNINIKSYRGLGLNRDINTNISIKYEINKYKYEIFI